MQTVQRMRRLFGEGIPLKPVTQGVKAAYERHARYAEMAEAVLERARRTPR